MRLRTFVSRAAAVLTLGLVAAGALAQSSMGTVSGTVTDTAGAVVPGASVMLVNQDTNVQSSRLTNSDGHFVFVNARPGTYTLTIQLTGFATAKLPPFTVGVNETVARNVTLKVGAVEENVEVTAQSELLQSSTSELGNVIEEKVIKDMPLQGRNFTQMMVLTPGVNPVSTAQGPGQNGADSTAINSFEGNTGIPGGYFTNASIQGQQNRSKIFYVDGIVNTSVRAGSYVALPDIDSLQEFKVQSHGDKAEYGGVTGGVVNMTSKSGGNGFHGTAFGFFRNDGLSARNPYRDVVGGLPIAPPEFRQSQFGANIGGPIIKDKTFFFASYDGWRFREMAEIRAIVPPNDNWLNGDFTGFRPLFNPYTTRVVNGVVVRDPFPNNQIPASLISPTMQQLLRAYMVRPNLSGSQVVNNFNFVDFREQTNDSNAFQVRIDHHFSAGDNIFFRWTERRIDGYLPWNDVGFKTPESINRNWGGGWFHTFSPNMILEVRGGVATQPTEDAPLEHPAALAPQQGTALPSLNELQGYVITGLSTSPWSFNPGQTQLGVQGPRPRENPNWNVAGDLTWLRGKHNFKAGFQMLRISRLQKNQFGELLYNADPTRNGAASAATGDVLASALLGLPNQIRGFVPDLGFIEFHTSTLSGYVQDQWSVKPNLTLTYGLRYDYITRAYGESGTFQSGPDFRTGEWLLALPATPPACSTVANQPPCLPKPLDQIPNNQFIRAIGEYNSVLPPIKDNFGPRLGVAWQINPKTVLRTGYALMWDSMVSRSQYGQHQFETWGWPQVSGFDTGTINAIGAPLQRLESFSSLAIGVPRDQPWNSTGFFNAPDRKNAYSHQWHVELQRQLTRNLMVGAAYVGSYNGRMEYSGRAAAPKVPAIDAATGRRLTPAERDQLREWPHINGDFRYSDDIGMSKFNSLQLKAQQRFHQGFTTMLSYTWSRTIDTSSGWFDAEGGIGGRPVQNFWDIDSARAVSAYDIPHILTWASTWELPFGQGKRWLSNGAASALLGNWQVSWMLLARSGQPMAITAGGDPANLGFSNYARADLVGDPELDEPTPDKWFNTAAFAAPVNAFGNSPRSVVRAPGFWNVDLSVQKNVLLGRGMQLQLRAEAFNLFNNINDGNPNVDITNANFGRITSMAGRPRMIQFGVRFVY
jgi:outer membrane receptor protein involved in Fe transport